ncbi:MAG: sugar transferase [Roseburia sp.]|nr:sugar transferase [Roseburia sp.]
MKFFLKRIMDVTASVLGLIVLSPLLVIIAIAVKIDSKGPILFKQERLTKDGKKFRMLKFRSMVVDAERQGAGLFNFKDDPRVTKVGRVLRNSSLDELPQLINVLQGSLSLVGPRPPVTYELGDFATLNRKYKKRFQVKAGITGLAQVKGRNDISWDEKVKYDNRYIDLFEKYGIFIDIRILMETVLKVFKSQNIYEEKANESMNDVEAAKFAEAEIIRLAHLPDEEIETKSDCKKR